MNKKLSINIPEGYLNALNRRHNGATHTTEEIKECFKKLEKLFKKYNKNLGKLRYLYDVEWEEKQIEKHFMEPIWYNAHRRRKRYEKNIEECHRDMFYILTNFDGNGRERFCKHNSISPTEIYDDFCSKYLKEK